MRKRITYLLATVLIFSACEKDDDTQIVAGDSAAIAARIDRSKVRGAVSSMPADTENSMPELAAYITASFDAAPERAYFIYRWIRSNIAPDFERAGSYYIDYRTQTADAVFRSRTAVCTGYAALYYELCNLAGLEASQINGYGVMNHYKNGTSYRGYAHVWNAFKADGAWYLVDCSWATSAELDGSSDPDFFFATEPTAFVHRHLPYDQKWQLLAAPIEETSFWNNLTIE